MKQHERLAILPHFTDRNATHKSLSSPYGKAYYETQTIPPNPQPPSIT